MLKYENGFDKVQDRNIYLLAKEKEGCAKGGSISRTKIFELSLLICPRNRDPIQKYENLVTISL